MPLGPQKLLKNMKLVIKIKVSRFFPQGTSGTLSECIFCEIVAILAAPGSLFGAFWCLWACPVWCTPPLPVAVCVFVCVLCVALCVLCVYLKNV